MSRGRSARSTRPAAFSVDGAEQDIQVDGSVLRHGAANSSRGAAAHRSRPGAGRGGRPPAGSWRPHGAGAAGDLTWPVGLVPYSRRVVDGVRTAVMMMACSPSTTDRVCTHRPGCLPDGLVSATYLVDLDLLKNPDEVLRDGYAYWGASSNMPLYYLYVDTDDMSVSTVAVRKDNKGNDVPLDPFNWILRAVWNTHPKSAGLFKRRVYFGKPATADTWRWAVVSYEWIGVGHPNQMERGAPPRKGQQRKDLIKSWRDMLKAAATGEMDINAQPGSSGFNQYGNSGSPECDERDVKMVRMGESTQHEELVFALSVAAALEGMRPANREDTKLRIQRLVSQVQLVEQGVDSESIDSPHPPHVAKNGQGHAVDTHQNERGIKKVFEEEA